MFGWRFEQPKRYDTKEARRSGGSDISDVPQGVASSTGFSVRQAFVYTQYLFICCLHPARYCIPAGIDKEGSFPAAEMFLCRVFGGARVPVFVSGILYVFLSDDKVRRRENNGLI